MAISTDYRLPGVYSREIAGPRLNTTTGGNAVVAFVGPAIGYRSASQQLTLTGTGQAQLNNKGVLPDSYTVVGRNNGTTYSLNVDYDATQDAEGVTSIARLISKLSTSSTTVSNKQFTFYVAQPSFNILVDDNGNPIAGYVIKGTVTVGSYVEGTDYEIDYHTNTFMAKTGGSITNGTQLGIGYKWTTAEPIELMGEASYGLSHKYISKNAMGNADKPYTCKIVSCKDSENEYGDTPGAPDGYIEDVDYVVDYDTGKIARTASSRIPSFDEAKGNVMYIEYGYCAIKSGEGVTVSYNYTDESYNQATFFSNYNELASMFGTPWNSTTGEVQSPISLAAYIASKNGMSSCYGVAVPGVSLDGSAVTYPLTSWDTAFEALTIVDGIDIIVPVSGDNAVWALCREHINKMKENQDERVAVLGADGTSSVIGADGMIALAQSLNTDDMWLVSPSTFRFRNPMTNVVEVVPGYYAAAAVAGYNSSVAQYVPLTQKVISGLFSANEYNTKIVKRNECANGLMYIDEVSSALRILHGRTTSTASVIEQETNIILTKYYIIKTMRRAFSNGYIGSIITSSTLLNIKSSAHSILCSLRDNNFINGFSGLTVAADEINPTQVNISFSYTPVYGMNYIEISFSVDSNTTAA